MAGITLAQAQAQLDAWLAASTKVAAGQSYKIGDRALTRADASEIRAQIKLWNDMVKELSGDGSGVRIGRAVLS